MWTLYDTLIEGIDPDLTITTALRGRWQAYVEAGEDAGVASLLLPWKQAYDSAALLPEWVGRPLKELARRAKSWDGVEAAMGMAAINAWYNGRSRLESRGMSLHDPASPAGDVFRELRDFCRDKTVSIVGHFRGADALTGCREIRVFEREPREGDYPDAAEEYLIPGSDVVIVTGMAFTNKTMPRLMELARGAHLALTGPSVPMTETLCGFGASSLFGMTVWDLPGCREAILSGDKKSIWNHVGKVILK